MRVLGVIVVGVMAVCFCAWPGSALAKYSGGTGEPNDPYLIGDVNDLHALAADTNDYDKCFRLIADIDLDPNLPDRRVYTTAVIAPDTSSGLGFQGLPFTGNFDGDGKKIRNIRIDTGGAGNSYVGLFGRIDDGAVRNLRVEDAVIIGGRDSEPLGGLCGLNAGGTISSCSSSGSVSGGLELGGLCGSNNYGTIETCYTTSRVAGGTSSWYIGGLCGYNNYGTISGCYASGGVSGSNRLGGLCGYNCYGMINNCYSINSVSGNYFVGGLCGFNDYGVISMCYSTGFVSGDQDAGGFCGKNYGNSVAGCFWDTETSGMSASAGGTGLTTAEMQTESTFTEAGWDFMTPVWMLPYGASCPLLAWQVKYSGGAGTAEAPYLIGDVNDLHALAADTNDYDNHFRLIADIDLDPNLVNRRVYTTAVIAPDTSRGSADFEGTAFSGNFDGNGKRISNLRIDTGHGNCYLGLFGCIYGSAAQVRNLGIEDAVINGRSYSGQLGGLCGWNDGGAISNCYVSGRVTGGTESYSLGGLCGTNTKGTISNCYATGDVAGGTDSFYLGGLCGYNLSHGKIVNCYAAGSVSGRGCLGGLCGINYEGTISNCHAIGQITGETGSDYLGGLCGYNSYAGAISNCYATGSVSGFDYLGGLCGYNSSTISNCYSKGSVSGDSYKGGFCGRNNSGAVTACFWDTETSGMTTSAEGTGLTTDQMKTQSIFTDAGWDYVIEEDHGLMDIWYQPVGNYPRLFWEGMAGDGNYDEVVDIDDVAGMCSWWLVGQADLGGNERLLCDYNFDEIVNLQDFGGLAGNWMAGTGD